MVAQSNPLPDARTDRETQEVINLRLTGQKIEQEVLDLRRPYLLRNSQLITAAITSIGAIAGLVVLVSGDYFNAVKARYELLELQAQVAKKEADAKTAEANNEMNSAKQMVQEANSLRAEAVQEQQEAIKKIQKSKDITVTAEQKQQEAKKKILEAHKQIHDVNEWLGSVTRRSSEIQKKLKATNDLERAARKAFSFIVNASPFLVVQPADWKHFDRQLPFVKSSVAEAKKINWSELNKIGGLRGLLKLLRDVDKDLTDLNHFSAARDVEGALRVLNNLSHLFEKIAIDSRQDSDQLEGELRTIWANAPNGLHPPGSLSD